MTTVTRMTASVKIIIITATCNVIFCIAPTQSPDACTPPLPPANGSVEDVVRTDEGYEVTFECDDGLCPTGQFTARCGSDGRWLPDPADMKCSAPLCKFIL